MAQEKILGNQLNIADVAADLNPALTTDISTDLSPQLGGQLDTYGYGMVASKGNFTITSVGEVNLTADAHINISTPDRSFVKLYTSRLDVFGDGSPALTDPGVIRLFAGGVSGGFSTDIITNETAVSDTTFILPDTNGVDGEVLTKTAGGTEWLTPSGGGGNPLTADLDVAGYSIIGLDAVGSPAFTDGGPVSLVAGSSAASGYDAGDIFITSGSGTYAGDTSTPAGKIFIQGGSRTYEGAGGVGKGDNTSVSIKGGNGGNYSGAVDITGGNNSADYGFAGYVNIRGGVNSSGNYGYGGYVQMYGGEATGKYGSGGGVFLSGGYGAYNGGGVELSGGQLRPAGSPAYISDHNAGEARVTGGTNSTGTGRGGNAILQGGFSLNAGGGGHAIVQGANVASNTSPAGSVKMFGGNPSGGQAGNVEVHAPFQNMGAGEIQIWYDNNTTVDKTGAGNYVGLKAPTFVGSPPTNITFTLPELDGTAGAPLQTDGSGNLSFGLAPVALPTYTVGALPTVVAGAMIYVSDATTGHAGSPIADTGVQCFGRAGSPGAWIDILTGLPVA